MPTSKNTPPEDTQPEPLPLPVPGSIIANVGFMEAVAALSEAETYLAAFGPCDPAYRPLECRRDEAVAELAAMVDHYIWRRVAASLSAATRMGLGGGAE